MPKQSRLEELYRSVSKKVLTETLSLKPGETITIETWTGGVPIAEELVLQARKLGAFPLVAYEGEDGYVEGVRSAPKEAVGKMGKHEFALLSNSDAYVFIPGPPVSGYYPSITRQEFIDSTGYNSSWYDAAKKGNLRGARITAGYIGADIAKLLGKSRDDIVIHQLKAAGADFAELNSKAKRLLTFLKDGAKVTVKTDGGDLMLRMKGDTEIQDGVTDSEDVAAGNNMGYVPPGYVQKDIDTSTVDGTFSFSPSVTRFGLVGGTMRYRKGEFVEWNLKGSKALIEPLEKILPSKARVPAYMLVGLNPLMKYENGQDRFPRGAITLGVGIGAISRKATVIADGKTIVKEGLLV